MNKTTSLILYTKKGCPLCEEGKAVLEMVCEELDLTFGEQDIYEDDALLEDYQLLIPAVVWDGKLIASGRLSMEALKEILTKQTT
jgi:glutaredoxin